MHALIRLINDQMIYPKREGQGLQQSTSSKKLSFEGFIYIKSLGSPKITITGPWVKAKEKIEDNFALF